MSTKFQAINFELENLPTMPTVAMQMIELINSANTSADALAKVVSKDASVAVRVLKIANSSFYSMSRQVTSLSTAIVILGERTLKNLVLAASLRGMNRSFGRVEKMLWEDSMVCALGSRFLARKLALTDPEEAFMAGLFRHIGKVVMNIQHADSSALIADMLKSGRHDLVEQERNLFGASHAEVGAAVLEHWQLSEALSQVALHHYDVELSDVADQNTRNLICVVNIASEFPRLFGLLGEHLQVDLPALPGVQILALSQEKLETLVEEFGEIFEGNRDEFLS